MRPLLTTAEVAQILKVKDCKTVRPAAKSRAWTRFIAICGVWCATVRKKLLLNVMHPDCLLRPPLAVNLDQTHAAFVLNG